MKEQLIQKSAECEVCGKWCEADEKTVHHLFRRSSRPDLISDPNNLIDICPMCHWYATNNHDFERYLQQTFYANTRLSRLQRSASDAG
jgi:hypothetical protein